MICRVEFLAARLKRKPGGTEEFGRMTKKKIHPHPNVLPIPHDRCSPPGISCDPRQQSLRASQEGNGTFFSGSSRVNLAANGAGKNSKTLPEQPREEG
jgi:hypothetical protein